MQQRSFWAMGSTITIVIDSDEANARSVFAGAYRTFRTYERILSRFQPHSDLNALNRCAGRGLRRVGQTLWRALQHALWMAYRSDGLVTPAVGEALHTAGYDRDFRQMAGTLTADIKAPSPVPDWRLIQCDPRRCTVSLPAGMRLDLGGSAKGWTATLVARHLGRRYPTLVDAGGDIALSGPRRDGSPWPIEVADPLHPDRGLALLMLRRGGVATSGVDYRRWLHHGKWQHHLIDPRTGDPASTDLLTATVIAPTLSLAEMAAKVVLILGAEAGWHWLADQPNMAGLLVHRDGQIIRTPNVDRYCWQSSMSVSR